MLLGQDSSYAAFQGHVLASCRGTEVSADLGKATLRNLKCHNLVTKLHQVPHLEKEEESFCGKGRKARQGKARQGKARQEHFILGAVVMEELLNMSIIYSPNAGNSAKQI